MRVIVKYVHLVSDIQPLEAIQGPGGEQGAIIRSLCRMLDIAHQMQMLRIKRNPDLATALHYMTIDTPGGPQQVAMLESWAIAVWLAGLQTSRLSPKSQEVARILKQHAYAAIARAFGQPEVAESGPIPTAPTPEPSPILTAFDHIEQSFGELKEQIVGIDRRLLIMEQDRLGRRVGSGARLSAAQVGQLFMQLALLREQTGLSIEDAEKHLADQFGVAHIIDLDASEWPAVHQAILTLFGR